MGTSGVVDIHHHIAAALGEGGAGGVDPTLVDGIYVQRSAVGGGGAAGADDAVHNSARTKETRREGGRHRATELHGLEGLRTIRLRKRIFSHRLEGTSERDTSAIEGGLAKGVVADGGTTVAHPDVRHSISTIKSKFSNGNHIGQHERLGDGVFIEGPFADIPGPDGVACQGQGSYASRYSLTIECIILDNAE